MPEDQPLPAPAINPETRQIVLNAPRSREFDGDERLVWRAPEELTLKQRRTGLAKLIGWRSRMEGDRRVWSLNGVDGMWPDYTSSLDLVMDLVRQLPDDRLRQFTKHLMRRVNARNKKGFSSFSAMFFATPTEYANALIRTLSPRGLRVMPAPPLRTVVSDDNE